TNLVSTLALDIKIPSARLYQDTQHALLYNISQQINSAIGIYLGDGVGDSSSTGSSDGSGSTGSSSGSGSDGGTFANTSASSTSSNQKAKTVGIAVGACALAGAYGGAMFLIARRYKRKRLARTRSSSLSNPSMRQTGSPALMGGALMSREFSNYGAVSGGGGGGAAGGRDSQTSGRSNMNNSGRTAYISAPVAAENSLGWN
ncbi:hypothetical protein M406DRAFT_321705, partial [Cryphonectria parasitica EP155]